MILGNGYLEHRWLGEQKLDNKYSGTCISRYHIRHCNVWKWRKFNFTSSLLHFASISNLDRQYIQILLLRVFHLWSGTNIEYSSGVQSRSFFESTSPCLHSSWREQQHEAENGMEKHSNIAQKRTIYNYTTGMWYLQKFVRFWLNKGEIKPSNCAHEMASNVCEIWHFVDLNLHEQKSSCSPHTNFGRNYKTISRHLYFLFSAFPTAKSS